MPQNNNYNDNYSSEKTQVTRNVFVLFVSKLNTTFLSNSKKKNYKKDVIFSEFWYCTNHAHI